MEKTLENTGPKNQGKEDMAAPVSSPGAATLNALSPFSSWGAGPRLVQVCLNFFNQAESGMTASDSLPSFVNGCEARPLCK